MTTYGAERARTAIAFAMNAEFSRVLQVQRASYFRLFPPSSSL